MNVIVIGGGASGMISAIYAAKNNKVTILERNQSCGKKLLATGNGKCNYYNEDQSLTHYHTSNPELLAKIINKNNLQEVEEFFKRLGIVPKIKNGYYYPFSNQATTIKNALLTEINNNKNITIEENVLVEKLEKQNNKFIITTNTKTYYADKVILATGSSAAPKTGSDGLGYKLLKELNHPIIKVLPALVQLKTKGNFLKDWSGIRTDVKVSLYEDDQFIREESGEIQLTNYGVSGICIFNLSRFVSRGLDQNKKEVLKINFLPFTDTPEELLSSLSNNRSISNILEGILNNKLVTILLNKSSINKDKKYNELSSKEKSTLLENLTKFSLEVYDTNSFDECQVCSGGLPLTKINLETMESNIVKNLHIVGELLDVDGDCGGYNLTFAWITGILAGRSESND